MRPLRLVALLAVAAACASTRPPGTRHSMKGWELYTWRAKMTNVCCVPPDVSCFALLVGTNRLKTVDEVTAPEATLRGPAELKAALATLAPGEAVRWRVGPLVGNAEAFAFEMPPKDVETDVETFCRVRGVELR